MKTTVFLDIDTQYDFMKRGGKLYVPDAEEIIPNLKMITQFARKKNIVALASTDKHTVRDKEIASGNFPPHCLKGTAGQKKIRETNLKGAVSVPRKKLSIKRINSLKEKNRLIIEKQEYNVFSNPNLKPILKGVKRAYVYGVATDYCVKVAILNLRKMRIQTYVIKDAIKAVFKENEKKDLELFTKKGAKFLTTKQLLRRKYYI